MDIVGPQLRNSVYSMLAIGEHRISFEEMTMAMEVLSQSAGSPRIGRIAVECDIPEPTIKGLCMAASAFPKVADLLVAVPDEKRRDLLRQIAQVRPVPSDRNDVLFKSCVVLTLTAVYGLFRRCRLEHEEL